MVVADTESEGVAYRIARGVLKPILTLSTSHRWEGLAHIPREGGCVVVANHLSYFDPLIVGQFLDAAGRAPRFLGKAALFDLPVLGTLLSSAGQIPVHRESVDAAKALDAAVDAVGAGECVVIYPEGTLTRDNNLWPMKGKTGAARVAAATGCPVIPVAHWGAQHILGRGQKVPRLMPRKPVEVRAGSGVDLGDFAADPDSPDALRAATASIMAAITLLLSQIRSTDQANRPAVNRDGAS